MMRFAPHKMRNIIIEAVPRQDRLANSLSWE